MSLPRNVQAAVCLHRGQGLPPPPPFPLLSISLPSSPAAHILSGGVENLLVWVFWERSNTNSRGFSVKSRPTPRQ